MAASQLSEHEEEIAQQILKVFESQDENGDFLYSDGEVRHFLPALLLMSGVDPKDYPTGALGDLFQEFRVAAGVDADATAQQYVDKAVAFYEESPPSESLMAAVRELVNNSNW